MDVAGNANSSAGERSPVEAVAFEVYAWAQAHGGDTTGRFDSLIKEVRDVEGRRILALPALDLALDVPPVNAIRHRAVPRGHSERVQGKAHVRYWSFASATDSLLTVAVSKIEGEEGSWSAHISRGPLRQYVDRFTVDAQAGSLVGGAAPHAAPFALAISEVLLPLQQEIQRLGGPRKTAPHWDPTAVL